MNPLRIFLLAALLLVVFGTNNVEADEKDPEWTYSSENSISSLEISSNGDYIVASSGDLITFSTASSTPLWTYSMGVDAVSISSEGDHILASDNDEFAMFDIEDGNQLWTNNDYSDILKSEISPNGLHIVIVTSSNVLLFNNIGEQIWSYEFADNQDDVGVKFSGNSEYIIVGIWNNEAYLFGLDSGVPIQTFSGGNDYIGVNVAINYDGSYIYSAGQYDGSLFTNDSTEALWTHSNSGNGEPATTSVDMSVGAEGEGYVLHTFGRVNCEGQVISVTLDLEGNVLEEFWGYTTATASGQSTFVAINGDAPGACVDGQDIYYYYYTGSSARWTYDPGDDGGESHLVAISSASTYVAAYTTGDNNNHEIVLLVNNHPDLSISDEDIVFQTQNPTSDDDIIINITVFNYGTATIDEWQVRLYDDDPDSGGVSSVASFYSDKDNESHTLLPGENYTFQSTWHGTATDPGYNELYVVAADSSQPTQEIFKVNNKASSSIFIEEGNLPPEITGITPTSVLEGQSSGFVVTAFDEDGDELVINWTMGDGTSYENAGAEVFHSFTDDGEYDVTITAYDGMSTTTITYNITVNNVPPTLSASYDDYGHEGQSHFFNAQTEDVLDDTVTVTWTFPDGTQVGGNFVEYLFVDDGEFLISVVANDEDGGQTVQQRIVTIENVAPIFTEFVIPSQVKQYIETNFSVSASDPGDDTTIYGFDFGDGTLQLLTQDGKISHKYVQDGTFTVTICANDEDGGETCRQTVLPVTTFELPTAIAGSDMTVKPGDTVQFNGAGTSDEDGVIVLYEWDFDGDGIYELSSEDNGRTTNIYNIEGEYNPTLRVTDNIGHTASNSFKITVKEDSKTEDPETEDPETEDPSIPSISLITSIISIGLLAIFRRK